MNLNYDKFREWLTLKGYSSATVNTVARLTADFLEWACQENIPDSSEMGYNDLMAYVKACQDRGVSQKAIAHYVSDVRKLYDFLISEGLASDNPAAFIKLHGIKRRVYHALLSVQELQQLYQAYPVEINYAAGQNIPPQEQNLLSRRRNKVIVGLLINQGLRVEEIKALKVQDLHLREGKITIHSQRRTAQRTLELEAAQVYELMDYLGVTRQQFLEAYREATDDLFIQRHKSVNFYGITRMVLQHLRKINKGVKTLDQVRASVITHWVRTHDLRKAQYMAGHRYVSSTEEYKQQLLDALQGDIQKFHPL
jgi:site-specific recombinase XerD